MTTNVGKLQVEVNGLLGYHRAIRVRDGIWCGPFWHDKWTTHGTPAACPRIGKGPPVYYPNPPSAELLNLIDHFHETQAVMPLLDKLVEEYPETQAIVDEVLS